MLRGVGCKLIEDVFTPEQKSQIVERLTDATVSIEGENMRRVTWCVIEGRVTWCVIEEVKSGEWAIGGKQLRTEDVHALAAGVPA